MIAINCYIRIKCWDLILKINPYQIRLKSHPYVILRYLQLPSLIVSNNWPKMADPYSTRIDGSKWDFENWDKGRIVCFTLV